MRKNRRVRTVREMGRAIKRDWDRYGTGLLAAAGIVALVSLLGHGLCPSRELLWPDQEHSADIPGAV